ncbi:hypothetical protein IIF7_20161 [Zunongwangia atlantica 22II14-10F7]|uniref:Uncharacterized protein n=1 Tax=Zunongwangia atlantica 22II14-10F7 TaxID=1185767 RepID=A0A1Y1SXR6_9FLAO|nr:hypothetical protein IIF7_20161 [Zunongwangia atlantica 22II14-10F7]
MKITAPYILLLFLMAIFFRQETKADSFRKQSYSSFASKKEQMVCKQTHALHLVETIQLKKLQETHKRDRFQDLSGFKSFPLIVVSNSYSNKHFQYLLRNKRKFLYNLIFPYHLFW